MSRREIIPAKGPSAEEPRRRWRRMALAVASIASKDDRETIAAELIEHFRTRPGFDAGEFTVGARRDRVPATLM
jgi:hypothetical protein